MKTPNPIFEEYYNPTYFIDGFRYIEDDKILHDLMRKNNESNYKPADVEKLISIYQLKQAKLTPEEIMDKIESLTSISSVYSALRRYYGYKAKAKGDYFELQYLQYLTKKLEPLNWYVERISGPKQPDIVAYKDNKMVVFSLKNEQKLTYFRENLMGEIRYINDNLQSYPNTYLYLIVFNRKTKQVKIETVDFFSFEKITINFT